MNVVNHKCVDTDCAGSKFECGFDGCQITCEISISDQYDSTNISTISSTCQNIEIDASKSQSVQISIYSHQTNKYKPNHNIVDTTDVDNNNNLLSHVLDGTTIYLPINQDLSIDLNQQLYNKQYNYLTYEFSDELYQLQSQCINNYEKYSNTNQSYCPKLIFSNSNNYNIRNDSKNAISDNHNHMKHLFQTKRRILQTTNTTNTPTENEGHFLADLCTDGNEDLCIVPEWLWISIFVLIILVIILLCILIAKLKSEKNDKSIKQPIMSDSEKQSIKQPKNAANNPNNKKQNEVEMGRTSNVDAPNITRLESDDALATDDEPKNEYLSDDEFLEEHDDDEKAEEYVTPGGPDETDQVDETDKTDTIDK